MKTVISMLDSQRVAAADEGTSAGACSSDTPHRGATQTEWFHWNLVLGLESGNLVEGRPLLQIPSQYQLGLIDSGKDGGRRDGVL